MSDRKYRQKGYMDQERGQGKRPGKGPPPPRKEGPRGRGLGKPTVTLFRCRDCGTRVLDPAAIAFETTCAKCGAALHSCVNCGYFDPSARWECRQEIPERVRSKAKANECTFFQAKLVSEFEGGKDDRASPDEAKAAFDALFKL